MISNPVADQKSDIPNNQQMNSSVVLAQSLIHLAYQKQIDDLQLIVQHQEEQLLLLRQKVKEFAELNLDLESRLKRAEKQLVEHQDAQEVYNESFLCLKDQIEFSTMRSHDLEKEVAILRKKCCAQVYCAECQSKGRTQKGDAASTAVRRTSLQKESNENIQAEKPMQQPLSPSRIASNPPEKVDSPPHSVVPGNADNPYPNSAKSLSTQHIIYLAENLKRKNKNGTLKKKDIINLVLSGVPKSEYKGLFQVNESEGEWQRKHLEQWNEEVLVLFNNKRQNTVQIRSKVSSLVDKYIPDPLRGKIWKFFIGNQLHLSQVFVQQHFASLARHSANNETLRYQIDVDVIRTETRDDTRMQRDLYDLLLAFSCYRPDIGYIQGMLHPATMLLMQMDVHKAFKCFANLILKSDLLRTLYSFRQPHTDVYFQLFMVYAKEHAPQAHQHLTENQIPHTTFLVNWSYTLFARQFSFQTAAKIWDWFIVKGDRVFFRVSLAILALVQRELISKRFEDSVLLMMDCCKSISEEQLFNQVRKISLPEEKFVQDYQLLLKKRLLKDAEEQNSLESSI